MSLSPSQLPAAGRTLAASLLAAFLPSFVFGQQIPTGYQDYVVIGNEQHVWNMMNRVRLGEGGGAFQSGTNSVVSAVASANNQVIIYDHWEDGYEANILSPVQATTLVLGDANIANGRACDWTTDPRVFPCDGVNDDVLFQGSFVVLNSDQGLGGGCTLGIRCSVPVNPRVATDVRFDGGDYVVTSGGPLSIVHNQDPLLPFIGGSTEMISRQAIGNATSYYVPAGENLYLGNNTVTEPFKYVDLEISAFENATQVFIDSPGAGTVSFTLNKGQHYTSRGLIDNTAAAPITINSGTKVSTTKPVAGMIFTGGDGTYATDFFALLPDLLHGTDYVTTAPGDNPGTNGNRPLNLYIFNPNPLAAINVTVTDNVGTATVAVPANSVVDYFTGTGRFVPFAAGGSGTSRSTVRLTSARPFWGLSAYDHQSAANDWGHSWLATSFLTNTYTSSYAPGVQNPAFQSQPAQRLANDLDCTIPPAAAGLCDTLNRSPLWISAIQDSTLVRIDFNNDGVFDVIDLNSDDFPDAAPLPGNTYVINAGESLRVYDYNDYDNTGTFISANKPVAVAYGQDTDQATGPDPIQDTGYVIFPINRNFLDPVLTIDKTTSVNAVPTGGGAVTYSLTVNAFNHGPITNLSVFDELPLGIPGTAYVAGSTLITYPNLVQSNADPAISLVGGRTRLTWTLSPNQLNVNEVLTIRYTVNLPAGPVGLLTNTAHAEGTESGRTFSAADSADVVRTDVTLTKSVTDDGSPEPGDVLTYSLVVRNTGLGAEINATIIDPIPAGTTFVTGSITTSGPFLGTYSAAQNAVVWTAASFPAGSGPFTLTFQARINPGVPLGSVITNQAGYQSTLTPYFLSNPVQTVVVGPSLQISKSGPAVLHPGERASFEILVRNVGTAAAINVFIRDPFPTSAAYAAGSMSFSLNSAPFVALTDPADADQGTLTATAVEFLLGSLGPNQDVRFRFEVIVTGTAGQLVNNQATVSADNVNPDDTNLVQVPIVGNAVITGRVFLDTNGNGVQDATETGLANVTVSVTDSSGVVQLVTTNANGDYTVTVVAGSTVLDVDQTDPDIPAGSVLTTANDPQTRTAVAASTVAATPVGYQPPGLSIRKTSNAPGGELVPGQTVTYTITVTNNTGATQTGIQVTDPLPTGTSYVANSTRVTAPTNNNTFRVTEAYIGAGTFTGATLTITLPLAAPNLQPNYFAIAQGGDGTAGSGGTRNPAQNYVSVTNDPFGTGDFAGGLAANQLLLTRGAASSGGSSWIGVVTVVECLGDCTTSGFRLLDVQRVAHAGGGLSSTDNSAVAWTNINRAMLMGGFNGAGCNTADTDTGDHKVCHARFFPSGTNTLNWTRNAGGSTSMSTATSTVMVVEWGSEWTVQRARIQGGNGGGGVDAAGEYNTAAIGGILRDRTWVWGTGHTNDQSIGEAAEAVVLTLGNGVAQNVVETTLAAGIEVAGNALDFETYALTHPFLAVDYRFKVDGDTAALTFDQAVDPATTANARMALSYNSSDEVDSGDNNYSRPMFSARYLGPGNATVRLERARSGRDFAAWVQGIDFSSVKLVQTTIPATGGAPSNLVVPADGYSLGPGRTMTITYQATVDFPLAPGINTITNTATFFSTQAPGGVSASVTDTVVRPGVVVEYNNAGFVAAGGSRTYFHNVINTGTKADSFDIRLVGELGWALELLDPDTAAVIARDSNGDGTWDGGVTVNTGTLAVGASVSYHVRVNVPGGAPSGTEQTTRLFATSTLSPLVSEYGTDETTVLGPGDFGPIILLPDNSGVANAGQSAVYTHRIINNTGATDTFDLVATSSNGWTARYFYDSNGDGVYTPGVDIQINNTLQLANGQIQLLFMVVDVPLGTPANTTDVTALTAISRVNPNLFDGAIDTTTVVAARSHDLSGGGTRLVQPGITAVFPGTLYAIGTSGSDTFNFRVNASSLNGGDGLNHGTQLWIDTNNDGLADRRIGEDTNGDGTWDFVDPAFNTDADGFPDVVLAAGAILNYELRRPIDPNMRIPREFVTFTAASTATGDLDSVTADVILANVTRATIRGLRVDPAGVVLFATSSQRRTQAFLLYETDDPSGKGELLPLTDDPVRAPTPDSLAPVLYRATTRPVTRAYLFVEEIEIGGRRRMIGPFDLADRRLARAFDRIQARMDRAGVAAGDVRVASPTELPRLVSAATRKAAARVADWRLARVRRNGAGSGAKVEVSGAGTVSIPLSDLLALGLPAYGRLRVTNQGQIVPHGRVNGSLIFNAEALVTDYTARNVYLITPASAPLPRMTVALSRSGDPPTPGTVRVEKTYTYVASAPLGADPWLWDLLVGDQGPWPYPGWDPDVGRFDLPGLVSGATGPVPVRIRLVGYTSHLHTVEAWINGVGVGSVSFDGAVTGLLTGTVPAEALLATGNELTLLYTAAGPNPSDVGLAYLDYLELDAPVTPAPSVATVVALDRYEPELPDLSSVRYLVVTHPLFRGQADRIAALKQAEGLPAVVVETEAAYDRFSTGIQEASAIRALIREAAYRSRRLQYVLLVGDDTLDTRDILGTGALSYLPSLLGWDGEFGRIPSENLYADLDGDGKPELAIGRLPVETEEQATAAADKIAGQSQALDAVKGRHLFAVDNAVDPADAPFRAEAEEMAATLPPGSAVAWSDLADGATSARSALLAGWQAGAMVTHYFGHAGPEVWADESLLTTDDVTSFGATLKPTVLLTWACESQWYLNLWGPTVNEALYLSPASGALAAFGPSGISAPAAQRMLYEELYRVLPSGYLTLGQAVRTAKGRALDREPASRTAVDGFNLLGDPALRLPAN